MPVVVQFLHHDVLTAPVGRKLSSAEANEPSSERDARGWRVRGRGAPAAPTPALCLQSAARGLCKGYSIKW